MFDSNSELGDFRTRYYIDAISIFSKDNYIPKRRTVLLDESIFIESVNCLDDLLFFFFAYKIEPAR